MTNLKKLLPLGLVVILTVILSTFLLTCEKKSNDPNIQTHMIDYRKIPLVEGTLNGRKALFILDTGATISIIDINQIKEYNIQNTGTSEGTVVGYGGTDDMTYDLKNVDVKVGKIDFMVSFQGKNIANIVRVIKKYNNRQIVGIIGNDNISDRNLILNFRTGEITK